MSEGEEKRMYLAVSLRSNGLREYLTATLCLSCLTPSMRLISSGWPRRKMVRRNRSED